MGRNALRTLEDWNALGYRVTKGSKMQGRTNAGVALFSEGDVYKPSPRTRRCGRRYYTYGGSSDHGNEDYDEGLSAYDYGADY